MRVWCRCIRIDIRSGHKFRMAFVHRCNTCQQTLKFQGQKRQQSQTQSIHPSIATINTSENNHLCRHPARTAVVTAVGRPISYHFLFLCLQGAHAARERCRPWCSLPSPCASGLGDLFRCEVPSEEAIVQVSDMVSGVWKGGEVSKDGWCGYIGGAWTC